MITEDYVSFETAKLLKEKGFDWSCHATYDTAVTGGKPKFSEYEVLNFFPYGMKNTDDKYGMVISAPTLQMAMKWLRERNWFICIIPLAFYCGEKAVKFGYNIWADDNLEVDEFSTPKFNTYEEACEAAIKYCLENLI